MISDITKLFVRRENKKTYLTFNIIGLNTIVKTFEDPRLSRGDLSLVPPGRAPHVEEVRNNSLHRIPSGGSQKMHGKKRLRFEIHGMW